MKYRVIPEKTATGYSAYSPDLEGFVTTGATRAEVEPNLRDAIAFHLEGMPQEGDAVPEARSESACVEVALPAGASYLVW